MTTIRQRAADTWEPWPRPDVCHGSGPVRVGGEADPEFVARPVGFVVPEKPAKKRKRKGRA